MHNELRWDCVRYFVAVAQAGSVIGAARRFGVSHATVMRSVARLESQLGVRLFDHVRSGYRITAEGEEILGSALAMEEHAETMLRRALGKSPAPRGRLTLLVADESLFDPMPLLRRFRRAQPQIELAVEEAHSAAETRLSQLRADVAILVTNAPPENLVGRQLARLGFACFASPTYLAEKAGGVRAKDLDWIVWGLGARGELDENWHAAILRRLAPRPRVVLRAEHHRGALAAVRAGVGAGLLSTHCAAALERLPFPQARETIGIWVLTHPDLRHSGKVRAFLDFVAEHWAQRGEWSPET